MSDKATQLAELDTKMLAMPAAEMRDLVLKLASALYPFSAFADVLEPGDHDENHPWSGSYVHLGDDEGDDVNINKDSKPDTAIVQAGTSWRGVPASYITGLSLEDFRVAAEAMNGDVGSWLHEKVKRADAIIKANTR
jgi:hypothetical protein